MKKYFLLCALACGLAVVSTSEVQGDGSAYIMLLGTPLACLGTAIYSGYKATKIDSVNASAIEYIAVTGGILIPMAILAFSGYILFCAPAASILLLMVPFVLASTWLFYFAAKTIKLFFSNDKKCKQKKRTSRKQRKCARHRKKQELVIVATV